MKRAIHESTRHFVWENLGARRRRSPHKRRWYVLLMAWECLSCWCASSESGYDVEQRAWHGIKRYGYSSLIKGKTDCWIGDGTYTPWFGTWHVEDTCGFPSSGLHMRLDRMSPRILNLILSGNCARSIIRSMSLHNMALRSDRGQTLGSTNCFCYARESLWKNDGQISDSGHRSFIGYYVGIAQGTREDIDEWRGV